jgi:hypothetical protein
MVNTKTVGKTVKDNKREADPPLAKPATTTPPIIRPDLGQVFVRAKRHPIDALDTLRLFVKTYEKL